MVMVNPLRAKSSKSSWKGIELNMLLLHLIALLPTGWHKELFKQALLTPSGWFYQVEVIEDLVYSTTGVPPQISHGLMPEFVFLPKYFPPNGGKTDKTK